MARLDFQRQRRICLRRLNKLRKQTVIDDEALDACLKEMALALLSHDVNVKYVSELRKNVKSAVT